MNEWNVERNNINNIWMNWIVLFHKQKKIKEKKRKKLKKTEEIKINKQ